MHRLGASHESGFRRAWCYPLPALNTAQFLRCSKVRWLGETADLLQFAEKIAAKRSGALRAFPQPMNSAVGITALTQKVIGCAIAVHRGLGPGLLESVYRECMVIELRAQNLRVECERSVRIEYRGQRIGGALKIDLLVEGCLIVELKAVEQLHPVHPAQVLTYLKLTGCPAGLLINFNVMVLTDGLKRLDHPALYVPKRVHGKTGGRSREVQETP
jgi:GxxExxY protein